MPDVIFNAACVNFCAWAYDEGVFDSDAATEIVNSLGVDTYSAKGVLAMSEVEPGVYPLFLQVRGQMLLIIE